MGPGRRRPRRRPAAFSEPQSSARSCRPARESRAGRNGRSTWSEPGIGEAGAVVGDDQVHGIVVEAKRDVHRLAPECLMVLVSASRPIRSRWCSSERSSGRTGPSVRTVALSGVPVVICCATSDSAPTRSRVSSALVSQVHDRAAGLAQAVAEHFARRWSRRVGPAAAMYRDSGRRRRAAAGCRPGLVRAYRAARSPGGSARR